METEYATRLAACYTVYNGIELLEDSINSIKNNVDEIIIAYQTTSNYGEINNDFLEWKEKNKEYHYVFFNPSFLGRKDNAKFNEANKHQLLIQKARKLKCTHWFLSATDHLYKHDEVEYVKKEIKKNNYKTTFTKLKTYFKENYYCLQPLEHYYMPFICSTDVNIKYCGWSPVKVDAAIKFDKKYTYKCFSEEEILMHHYSYLRYDIENKLKNAAAKRNWENKIPYIIDQFNNFKEGDKFFIYNKYDIVKCKPEFSLENYYKNKC